MKVSFTTTSDYSVDFFDYVGNIDSFIRDNFEYIYTKNYSEVLNELIIHAIIVNDDYENRDFLLKKRGRYNKENEVLRIVFFVNFSDYKKLEETEAKIFIAHHIFDQVKIKLISFVRKHKIQFNLELFLDDLEKVLNDYD